MNILQKYKFELLIILIQLIGPISQIGLICGCLYIFYLIGFKHKIDLVSIFILLIPSIAFKYLNENIEIITNQEIANNWIKLYLPAIKTIYIFGPIAVSIPFFAVLAVPFRLILYFKDNPNKPLLVIWFVVLLISLAGLFLAVMNKQKSDSGLTVGFRIALTIGAILFPFSIKQNQIEKQITIIVKISVIFFIIGLLNDLWKFVAFALFAFLVFSDENKVWKLLSIISLIIILSFQFSFTLLLTACGGIILVMLHSIRKSRHEFLKSKSLRILLFFFPVLFMLLVVSSNILMNNGAMSLLSERFQEKLFSDRVPLWTVSLDFILKSNFFIVPAARNIIIFDYGIAGERAWGSGAHNIYLEMARQLGVFATMLITVIIGTIFLKSFELLKTNNNLYKLLLSLFAVYLVWGLTGNALVWDGTGFLYWLIIGQLFQSGLLYNKNFYSNKER